jgi:hypothetical protein
MAKMAKFGSTGKGKFRDIGIRKLRLENRDNLQLRFRAGNTNEQWRTSSRKPPKVKPHSHLRHRGIPNCISFRQPYAKRFGVKGVKARAGSSSRSGIRQGCIRLGGDVWLRELDFLSWCRGGVPESLLVITARHEPLTCR